MSDTERTGSPLAQTVRVRLGIGAPGATADRGVDIEIFAPPSATVEEVVDRADLAVPALEWAVVNLRTGSRAQPDDPFVQLGAVHGDHLRIVDLEAPSDPGTVATWALEVIAGPAAGAQLPLVGRRATIGRDDQRAELALTDPSLSREHLRLERTATGWTVEDLGSRNGSAVDGTPLVPGRPIAAGDGTHIEAGRSTLRLTGSSEAGSRSARRALEARPDGAIGFNCPPRVAPRPFARLIDAPKVPEQPRAPRLPLVAAIVPAIAGVVLWRLTGQTFMLMLCALSPVMVLGTWLSDRLGGRAEYRDRRTAFRAELARTAEEVDALRADEEERRLDLFPDARMLARRMVDADPRLWERRASHHDLLHLRIGMGARMSEVVLRAGEGGAAELRDELAASVPVQPELESTPITVALGDVGPVGVTGPPELREGLLRWLLLQVAGLHSPRDVQLVALLGEADPAWDWLKWLPHVPAGGIGPGGAPGLGLRRVEIEEQLAALAALVEDRTDDLLGGAKPSGIDGRPHVVVFVRDGAVADRTLIGRLLSPAAQEAGVHVIWEADDTGALPAACRTLVELDEARALATITDTTTGEVSDRVTLDSVPMAVAESAAAAIAPLRDVTHDERGISSLPPVAALLELEGLSPVTPGAVATRWRGAVDGVRCILGAGGDGPLHLDLAVVGPHALVGGTSGAGKSELLRGMLASMALHAPPTHLTFLLVDYKGGSAFRELAQLPHTVGVVTDLDEHLADRALTSLRAEIRFRETVLADAGALDLAELRRTRPELVLPRLLIAIDEFATLAQEVPEFVDGVLDVVQRGRSLGVHLVLATQSPRGSVTGRIRANTALQIALRTLGRDESIDIIGSPEAAFISKRTPGRAWAKLGEDDLVPFQSGYVGAPPNLRTADVTTVQPFGLGRAAAAAPNGAAGTTPGTITSPDDTELRTIVDAARAAAAELPPARRPWLPELPVLVDGRAGAEQAGPGFVGIVDDPAAQRRRTLRFDPASQGNALFLGGPRSGRTSALAGVAASLAWGRSTDDLHVYGLDCAGRALGAVDELPHTGAVVAGDDGARTARLLEFLTDTLTARRQAYSELGAHDFDDLVHRSEQAVPRILLLVDDYGAFQERYEHAELGRLADLMRQLASDGPAFGIHLAITSDRRFAVPNAVHAVIGLRLVLRLGDRDEYARLGLKAIPSDLPPGRGFDLDGLEVQLGTWADPGEPLREAMARTGAALRAQHSLGAVPSPVQLLATRLPLADLPPSTEASSVVVGQRERDGQPARVVLDGAHFMVVGPYRTGRSTALATLAAGYAQARPQSERHLISFRRSPLRDLTGWATATESPDANALAGLLEGFAAQGKEDGQPRLVVLDDLTELEVGMANSRLEAAARACRDAGVCLLASGESQAVFTAFGFVRELRKDGAGLLLAPNLETHGEIFDTKLPFRRALEFPPGRAFLVRPGGTLDLIQVAVPS
ncbi:MAG: FtsK/SpoIIIE domain-containing protein [Patulibacter minatonensis]